MKFHISLQSRFLLTFVALLVFLITSILFIIGNKEVRAIFREETEKGVLIARDIAQLNFQPLVFYDEEGVQKNIDDQIDNKLLYIIFFDRYNKHFVSTDFVKNRKDIYEFSSLSEDADKESFYSQQKKINDSATGQVLHVLEIEIPIFAEESPQKWGSIKIGVSLDDMRREIFRSRFWLILIGTVGIFLGFIGVRLLTKRITNPLLRLVEGTEKVSRGDFSLTIPVKSQDEIGDLARSFNQMSLRLKEMRQRIDEANKKLIQAEKLASIGRISAGIAHEIRNPLTSVKLNIQKVIEDAGIDRIDMDHLEIAHEGINQIESFIKEMLNYTRVSDLNLDEFSMPQIIEESAKMVKHSMELKGVGLEKNYDAELPPIRVDADKLRLVFVNIMRNANEAVEPGGSIKIFASLVGTPSKRAIKIEISDNGCGIPERDKENIFEPYFTTKTSGFGLGLANARKIVEQHKGTIHVKKSKEAGTIFEIVLPYEEEK